MQGVYGLACSFRVPQLRIHYEVHNMTRGFVIAAHRLRSLSARWIYNRRMCHLCFSPIPRLLLDILSATRFAWRWEEGTQLALVREGCNRRRSESEEFVTGPSLCRPQHLACQDGIWLWPVHLPMEPRSASPEPSLCTVGACAQCTVVSHV